jgi:hypothetical protein
MEQAEHVAIEAFVGACGDGGGATPLERLTRAAGTVKQQRADAIAAGRDDLVERVDAALGGQMLLLPLDAVAGGWDLPASKAVRPATPTAYTVVTATEIHRARGSYARLSPADDSPLAEIPAPVTDNLEYPILVVANRDVPAARVLSIALADSNSSAVVAVVGPDGVVAVHRVQLSSADGARPLQLADGATVADLVTALDAAAEAGAAAATAR